MDRNRWSRLVAAAAVMGMVACGGGDGADETDAPVETPAVEEPAAPEPAGAFGNVQFPEGVTAEMASAGQTQFNQGVCMTCHGQNGIGSPLAPALNDQEWINVDGSYEQILQVIREGVPQPKQFTNAGLMPPMGGAQLTEEQMQQIAAYVFALSHGG